MRTTIEISDSIHLRLIEEAAFTGQRGFSGIVEKVLKQYFKNKGSSSIRKAEIQNLYGSIAEENDIDNLSIRKNWRTGRELSGNISENNS
ncbi:MAG: hypothetical protein KAH95_05995 [Spirochaetales bacterium]|nr:hypothetical protein [Spirochaetales bacterium]